MGNFNATVSGVSTAWTAITSWMTGGSGSQLGMTLVDTISGSAPYDAVYSTTGVGGNRQKLYIRVTQSLFDEAPGDSMVGSFDNVTFRLYRSWNTGTHTGQGEVGRFGPRFMSLAPYNYHSGYWLPATSRTSPYLDLMPAGFSDAGNYVFDGRRIWFVYSNSLCAYDMIYGSNFQTEGEISTTGATVAYALPSNQTSWTDVPLIYVTDPSNGRDYLYMVSHSTASSSTFWRYDIAQNSFSNMADVPWFTTSTQTCQICYDGSNYIYLTEGTGGTGFARYNITTNTWTSLAAVASGATYNPGTPINSNSSNSQRMMYVPASVSGYSSDQIFVYIPVAGTTYWLAYSVTGNTWTNPTTLPTASYQGDTASFCFAPNIGTHGTIYYTDYTNAVSPAGSVLYAYTLSSTFGGGTWSSQVLQFGMSGLTPIVAGSSGNDAWMMRHQMGKLIMPTTNGNLTLQGVGNADYLCIVASWQIPGTQIRAQRFAYAGFYNTYKNPTFFASNGTISPGTNVVVNTAASGVNSHYVVGDFIQLLDPNATLNPLNGANAANLGGGETVQIVAVAAQSVTLARVLNSYSVGTLFGANPMPACVTNDCGFVGIMQSPNGYQRDGESDWYRLTCLSPQVYTDLIDVMGQNAGYGFVINQMQPGTANQILQGELYNIGVLPSSAQPNEVSTQEANSYLAVIPYSYDNNQDPRGYQIGITNG